MKKLATIGLALVMFVLGAMEVASSTSLYVDSAPNMYGSPDYVPWWEGAKSSVAAGTFVNMANSSNASNRGTTNFAIEDLVVYSFGDLGSRMHFIYWLPDTTISDLTNQGLQVALDYQWDGLTYDFYEEYYGERWLTPNSWEEYNGGVIGTAGFAWIGAYGTETEEALAADLAELATHQGDLVFHLKLDEEKTITAYHHNPVPEPTTILLLGSGIASLVGLRLRRRQ